MALIDRLEAVVARLEQVDRTLRGTGPMAELVFNGYAGLGVLRADGSVEHHWDHPSFHVPRRHAPGDGCTVYPTVEAWQVVVEQLAHMKFG